MSIFRMVLLNCGPLINLVTLCGQYCAMAKEDNIIPNNEFSIRIMHFSCFSSYLLYYIQFLRILS